MSYTVPVKEMLFVMENLADLEKVRPAIRPASTMRPQLFC
ncbi:acyl-CoA dehydrogenase N-terminal domain-containing protein [Caballeronia cordobensis]